MSTLLNHETSITERNTIPAECRTPRTTRPGGWAVWCGILLLCGGCVGPVRDNVGTDFRAKWIAAHASLPSPYANVHTAEERNEFIDEFVAVKNIQFHNYVTAIRRGTSYGDLSADGSRIVLDSMAALVGGAGTKAALAAASAGVTGFNGSFKKDVLFDQAIPTFIEKMEELRAIKLADIINKKKLPIESYTRSEAYNDVEEYGSAGTFDAALRSLNVQTGLATAQAKADLSAAKGDKISAVANAPAHTTALTRVGLPTLQKPRTTTSDKEVDDARRRARAEKLIKADRDAIYDAQANVPDSKLAAFYQAVLDAAAPDSDGIARTADGFSEYLDRTHPAARMAAMAGAARAFAKK